MGLKSAKVMALKANIFTYTSTTFKPMMSEEQKESFMRFISTRDISRIPVIR